MYSTNEAARKAGVGFATLNRWIAQGKVKAPKVQRLGGIGVRIRLWTTADIKRLKKYKQEHLGEGRGRRTDLQKKQSRKRFLAAESSPVDFC